MERKMLAFCSVVSVLGLISAATGLAAEATRVKASDVYIEDGSCAYPSSRPTLVLGFISAMFAIITRIYITVTFGRFSCCQSDPTSTQISKLLYVLSWVASVVGVVLLLAAAALNDEAAGGVDSYGYYTCYVVKPGIYAAGAVLALLSAIFGVAAYVTLTSVKQITTNPAVDQYPDATDVDLEKSPLSHTSQQQ